jgi:hypothetical protein
LYKNISSIGGEMITLHYLSQIDENFKSDVFIPRLNFVDLFEKQGFFLGLIDLLF